MRLADEPTPLSECKLFKSERCDKLVEHGINAPLCCHCCPIRKSCRDICPERPQKCEERKSDVDEAKIMGEDADIKLFQYDLDGHLVKKWKSITVAANELGLDRCRIGDALRGRVLTYGGCIWLREHDLERAQEIASRNQSRKKASEAPIKQYDSTGRLMHIWQNRKQMLDANPSWTKQGVLNVLYGRAKTYKGYVLEI